MVLVLKKGDGKKEIEAIEKRLSQMEPGGFNAKKYNGSLKTLKLEGEPLSIQKKLRNAWDRDIS